MGLPTALTHAVAMDHVPEIKCAVWSIRTATVEYLVPKQQSVRVSCGYNVRSRNKYNGAYTCHCLEPPCTGDRYILRTNRRIGIIEYPGSVRNTNCGRFEGSLTIVATNGLCIKVTADHRYTDTKTGEMVDVYDGHTSNRLLWQGSSLRGVQVVSSGPIITVSHYVIFF